MLRWHCISSIYKTLYTLFAILCVISLTIEPYIVLQSKRISYTLTRLTSFRSNERQNPTWPPLELLHLQFLVHHCIWPKRNFVPFDCHWNWNVMSNVHCNSFSTFLTINSFEWGSPRVKFLMGFLILYSVYSRKIILYSVIFQHSLFGIFMAS